MPGRGALRERVEEFYDGKRTEGFADLVRERPPSSPAEERVKSFTEVDGCFPAEQAAREACRCLRCDLEIRLAEEMRMRFSDPV